MIIDDVGMAVPQGNMPVRMAVWLWPLPAPVLVLVMLVMCVQMLMLQRHVLVLKHLGIGRGP
jgi:hypothetical protein